MERTSDTATAAGGEPPDRTDEPNNEGRDVASPPPPTTPSATSSRRQSFLQHKAFTIHKDSSLTFSCDDDSFLEAFGINTNASTTGTTGGHSRTDVESCPSELAHFSGSSSDNVYLPASSTTCSSLQSSQSTSPTPLTLAVPFSQMSLPTSPVSPISPPPPPRDSETAVSMPPSMPGARTFRFITTTSGNILTPKQRRVRLAKKRVMPPRSNSTPLQPDGGSSDSVPDELTKSDSIPFKTNVLVSASAASVGGGDDLSCDLGGVPRTSSMCDTSSLVATGKVRESFQRRFMSNFIRQSSADDVIKSNLTKGGSGKGTLPPGPSSSSAAAATTTSALNKLRSSSNEKCNSAPIMCKQQSIDSLQEEGDSVFKQLVYMYKQNNGAKTTPTPPPPPTTSQMKPPEVGVLSVPTIVVNECLDDNKPNEEGDILK